MTDWTGVRERVLGLQTAHPGAVFGAGGHEFALEDPLTPEELAELERQLGVDLPPDYRDFLLEVGAGGAGPSYGIFPVRRADGSWRWFGDGAELADLALVSQPFPGPVGSGVVDEFYAVKPEEESFENLEDFDAAYEAWSDEKIEAVWGAHTTAGAICICHHGCALRQWLIVTGDARGIVWRDNRVDDGDLTPEMIDGEPATFGRWYLHWLGEAETALSHAR